MTTRFADHFLDGTHAELPAASTVPVSTLFACSDHGLIYRSDGTTWTTWATLSTGSADQAPGPAALVWNNAAQSVPNATLTAITHNSESFDTDGFHDTATNTSRLTIPTGLDGKYLITAGLRFNANATGVRTCTIRKNGSTDLANRVTQAISGWDTNMEATIVADLVAGDYVELVAYQTSGGALNTSPGSTYTTLALARTGS